MKDTLTKDEEYKLKLLKGMFTVDIVSSDPEYVSCIQISGCWKFTGLSIEECLDEIHNYVVDTGNRTDEAVRAEYEAGKAQLDD